MCVKNILTTLMYILTNGLSLCIDIGLPFYGRSFGSATGLDQPHSGADKSKWSLDDGKQTIILLYIITALS